MASPTPPKRLRSSLRAAYGLVPSSSPGGRGAATKEDSLAAEALISLCADSSGDTGPCAEPGAKAASAPDAAAVDAVAEARGVLAAGGAKHVQVGLARLCEATRSSLSIIVLQKS